MQRFTPRRPRCKWSKINREKAERLIAEGSDAARRGCGRSSARSEDGRWDEAYDSPTTATVPEDFQAKRSTPSPPRETSSSASGNTKRYSFLYRIRDAKRPETRAKRIAEYVELLREGKTLT